VFPRRSLPEARPRPWCDSCSFHLSVLVYAFSSDNIAPPIAACLGDLVTMTLLGVMSTLLIVGSGAIAPFLAIIIVIIWASASAYVVLRNEHVKPLLKKGWTPLFASMVITSGSGIMLDLFVDRYEGYGLLAVAFGGAYHPPQSHRCGLLPLTLLCRTCRYSWRHRLNFCITPVDGLAFGEVSHPSKHTDYFRRCGRLHRSERSAP
jgi:hypothetical protein